MVWCSEYMPDAIGSGEFTELLTCERRTIVTHNTIRQTMSSKTRPQSLDRFSARCSASGELPTTWYANQRSLGTCVPGKDPQSPHAVDSMDLQYAPTDGGCLCWCMLIQLTRMTVFHLSFWICIHGWPPT